MKKFLNGQAIDMTAEEIAEHEEAQASAKASNKIFDDEKQAREDLKASARAKLIAGEPLTEEEADTIVL
jgi:hypothetical protein